MKESHLRSILKSMSWRITATITTVIIAYFITGDTSIAVKIGALEVFIKLVVYYFHERLWLIVPLGTIRRVFKIFKKEKL